jgi:polysaccharide biosynthesis/export protein
MKLLNSFIFLGVISIIFTSCIWQRKTIQENYLQNVNDTTGKTLIKVPEPVIQKNDILSIQIFSASIIPEADAPYNLPSGQAASPEAGGFLVDASGNIQYPRIGTIKAEGLTKTQLADLIKQRLEGQLDQPSVIIRFVNYRITVLGEVGRPGTITFPAEKITILEALGLAGDITEFGKKSNVRVWREENGIVELGNIDLTSGQMFQSPYFHLKQNDVVFVDQTAEKVRERDRQRLFTQISVATTIITTIALIVNLTRNN